MNGSGRKLSMASDRHGGMSHRNDTSTLSVETRNITQIEDA